MHIASVGSPPPVGPATVTARFDGDSLYTGSSASISTLVFRFPVGGAFVVGDGSVKGLVTFWSSTWWKTNRLSGGPAPWSFKGFAQRVAMPWVASPGFAHAPATVPDWMGVLVASRVEKDGSNVTVTPTRMVVVHVALRLGLGRARPDRRADRLTRVCAGPRFGGGLRSRRQLAWVSCIVQFSRQVSPPS